MLGQILAHIRNWFVVKDGVRHGEYIIQDGSITLPFIQDGQYFRIVGSVFNDGVYQYPTSVLVDETFTGAVWSMAIPKDVIDLSAEIEKWVEDNKSVIDSPYSSESFGGYSYTKAGGGYAGSSDSATWQGHFTARLSPYKKV